MISFFQTLFENIKNKVDQLIQQVREKDYNVDFIFMVGLIKQLIFDNTSPSYCSIQNKNVIKH